MGLVARLAAGERTKKQKTKKKNAPRACASPVYGVSITVQARPCPGLGSCWQAGEVGGEAGGGVPGVSAAIGAKKRRRVPAAPAAFTERKKKTAVEKRDCLQKNRPGHP
jgi:hypothetical protein